MSDNLVLEAERSALRAEIASLEEQIAAFSSNKQRAAAPPPPQLKRPRPVENEHEDIEQTM